MKPILVTGVTGFIGWHVARALLDRNYRVRGMARNPQRVRELEAEIVTGDLQDRASLDRAMANCGSVFHVAADYRLWAKDPSELYRSNVEGTRNLLDAAGAAGVERVVYTSTVGCIGIPAGKEGNEDTPVTLDEMAGAYKRSKLLAEREALEAAGRSLPVVIVNPTAPVGDHDFKPTPTGKIIVDFLKGAMPAFLDTGLNVVDVRDVAEGQLLAWERGKTGERYILGSANLTLAEIFGRLETLSGHRAPRVRIPYSVAYMVGVVSTGLANLTGKQPLAPLDAVRMARKKMFVSSDKAVRELGYHPGAPEGALKRAVEWFQANGYC